MSTTNPPQAEPAAPAPTRPYAVPAVARLVGPAAVAAGGVLAGAGLALHLGGGMPEDERLARAIAEDPQWVSSHVLLGIGFSLVAIGAAQALAVVRGRGAALTAVGAVLTSLGAMLMALGDLAHGAVGLALRDKVGAAQSLDIHLTYFEHPAILGLNTGPLLITLGMVTLGSGLLRSFSVPRPQAAAVLLTPVAMHVGFALALPPYVQGLIFLVGMLVLARVMVRR